MRRAEVGLTRGGEGTKPPKVSNGVSNFKFPHPHGRLIFNDRGTQMLLIQNGSLLVTRGDRVEFYDDFCVEETGNMVLAAHICDAPGGSHGDDLFSGWLGTVMIVLALVASAITVLAYAFDRTLPHRYGPLIASHAGLLAGAILLELLLTALHQGKRLLLASLRSWILDRLMSQKRIIECCGRDFSTCLNVVCYN